MFIVYFIFTFALYAADDAEFCSALTEKVNELILSDNDSENDWETYGDNECECEIEKVREKYGDDYAERYAQYSEMGMHIEIKDYNSPLMTEIELAEWVAQNYPDFFDLLVWADKLWESWAEELNLGILEDPVEVCWD